MMNKFLFAIIAILVVYPCDILGAKYKEVTRKIENVPSNEISKDTIYKFRDQHET